MLGTSLEDISKSFIKRNLTETEFKETFRKVLVLFQESSVDCLAISYEGEEKGMKSKKMDPTRNEFNGNGADGSMYPVNNYIQYQCNVK